METRIPFPKVSQKNENSVPPKQAIKGTSVTLTLSLPLPPPTQGPHVAGALPCTHMKEDSHQEESQRAGLGVPPFSLLPSAMFFLSNYISTQTSILH